MTITDLFRCPSLASVSISSMGLAIALGTALSSSGAATADPEEAFEAIRLGEVKPEGWLRAQLQRDLESGFHGHLDLVLKQKSTGAPGG